MIVVATQQCVFRMAYRIDWSAHRRFLAATAFVSFSSGCKTENERSFAQNFTIHPPCLCLSHALITELLPPKASICGPVWAGWCGQRLSDIAGRTDI
jgi:hypothetical protein